MMRRWPIRIRLTAAFTAVMALVLLAVGTLTVAHTKESLDEAITESLSYRLDNLRSIAVAGEPSLAGGNPDTAQQIIASDGHVLAATPNLAGQTALSPSELDVARRGQLVADHSRLGNLEGPVRVAAGPAPGGRLVVAAQSLADRAASISATDAHARLPVPPARDEIHHLGTTFNELLQRLQDALERERQFVIDAGHELRTPLSLLTTELELAL